MKYLFIDESIDTEFYVVGGILTNNESDLLLAYNQLRRQVKNMSLTRKQKEQVTSEFKSTLLDKIYPSIKRRMLYKLNAFDCKVIFSYSKLEKKLNKQINEETYITLLTRIVNSIEDNIVVVTFDNFSNVKFENEIIKEIGNLSNVMSIKKDYSYNNKGLQFADNVVGVLRKNLTNSDSNDFYSIISNKVVEVKDTV